MMTSLLGCQEQGTLIAGESQDGQCIKHMKKGLKLKITCSFDNKKEVERILNKEAKMVDVDYSLMSENRVVYNILVLEESKDLIMSKLDYFKNLIVEVCGEELVEI